jgi:alginate O-acetyltransferase complex protein AlgI
MLFPTIEFAIFFPIVLGLSWLLMPRQPLWKPFIVAASYVFYAAADPRFCLLLGGITLGNQLAATLIRKADDERRRKWICGLAVAGDLLTLGVFKYYAFFVTDVGDVLDSIALGMPLPLLTIALPIGVSFFTFQAITYVVDVKRGDAEPASLIDAAIYLSFFPHLVAGPIVRASEFLPQLKAPRDPARVAVGAGLTLIALGLLKKVLIADTLAREIVDPVFGVPEAYFAPDAILATLAYATQIYCDFSGYTDIAIGLALLLGFIFPQNFNNPYRATGFRDFWRRWHMTLSRFLRDYLYIPLGGSRGSRTRRLKGGAARLAPRWFTYRNLMITMVLGGLWHGAAWTFVLWGGFHGAMLVTEHALDGRIGRRTPAAVRWLGTFAAVCFGWILFRSPDLDLFWTFLGRLVDPGAATLWTVPVVAMIAVVIGMQLLPPRPLERLQLRIERLRPLALAVGLAAVILLVGATVPSQGVPPFIYFQF